MLVPVLLITVAGCGGPAPLPAPCPPAVETARPTVALDGHGGAFVWGDEGLPSGFFVHRFDAAGALSWTVRLPADPIYEQRQLAAAGDTVFAVVAEATGDAFTGVRDGAVVFTVVAPFSCHMNAFEPEGAALRVYGLDGGSACSYRVGADGTLDDLLAFDADTAFALRHAADGGYLVVAKEGVVRYDAAANRMWTHAGVFTKTAIDSAGAVFAFRYDDAATTLVSIGADGQGELDLAAFTHDAGDASNSYLAIFTAPTSDGVVVAVEHDYRYTHELVRATAGGVVWSQPLDALAGVPLGGLSLGASVLAVRGKALVAYALDGSARWSAPAPVDAVIGADDRARVADDKTLDPCRQVLRVSLLDGSGQVATSWSAR